MKNLLLIVFIVFLVGCDIDVKNPTGPTIPEEIKLVNEAQQGIASDQDKSNIVAPH